MGEILTVAFQNERLDLGAQTSFKNNNNNKSQHISSLLCSRHYA